MASSAQSLCGLTTSFQSLKLKDVDGEDVTLYASFARGAFEILHNNASTPDALEILSKALQACETAQFSSYILSLYHYHEIGIKTLYEEEFLNLAEASTLIWFQVKNGSQGLSVLSKRVHSLMVTALNVAKRDTEL